MLEAGKRLASATETPANPMRNPRSHSTRSFRASFQKYDLQEKALNQSEAQLEFESARANRSVTPKIEVPVIVVTQEEGSDARDRGESKEHRQQSETRLPDRGINRRWWRRGLGDRNGRIDHRQHTSCPWTRRLGGGGDCRGALEGRSANRAGRCRSSKRAQRHQGADR